MRSSLSKKAALSITALLMTTLFFVLLWATQHFRFENSDDILLMKAFLQCAGEDLRFPFPGVAAGGFYLIVFSLFLSCRLNRTTAAALVGAASVALLLTVGKSWRNTASGQGPALGSILLSIVLLVCAYCLRSAAALPSLVFVSGPGAFAGADPLSGGWHRG